jgi:predicted dehydrogenase
MKIGVVGNGSIGARHAANLEKLGHKPVVFDPAHRMDVRRERDVYEICDAVVVATPTLWHQSGIRACIERGKHVLVEKPIGVNTTGLAELLDVAKSKKLVVMMGNNLRFHHCTIEAEKWLKEKRIGEPIWAQFTCATLSAKTPYLSDGVILNTGAHEVDLAIHLLGPAKVLCATAGTGAYGDDIADFVLLHDSGVRAAFHLDFLSRDEIRCFHIIGPDGILYCDLPSRFLHSRLADPKLPGVVHVNPFQALGSYESDYLDEMSAFLDRIEGKKDVPGATGQDGLDTLRILLDVRKKAGLS